MIKLIIGLGNPGEKYAETRHNLGFMLLDKLLSGMQLERKSGQGEYYVAQHISGDRKIRLIWPTTYMNRSGVAVTQAMENYEVGPENLLLIFDDFNIPLGTIRIRTKGSHGGHNGMESVIYHLETEDILRLRLGIGPIPDGIDSVNYLLDKFAENEAEKVNKMLEKGTEAVLYLLKHRPEEAMSLYNPAPEDD